MTLRRLDSHDVKKEDEEPSRPIDRVQGEYGARQSPGRRHPLRRPRFDRVTVGCVSGDQFRSVYRLRFQLVIFCVRSVLLQYRFYIYVSSHFLTQGSEVDILTESLCIRPRFRFIIIIVVVVIVTCK